MRVGILHITSQSYVIGIGDCKASAESTSAQRLNRDPRQAIVQLRDAVQHTAMSASQALLASHQHITPPSSFAGRPLTPPPTDEKPFTQAPRVIALFWDIRVGRHTRQGPWREFKLAAGEYDEIERQLSRDTALSGYVKDKIRCVCSSTTELAVND
jgi:hypothetical protein